MTTFETSKTSSWLNRRALVAGASLSLGLAFTGTAVAASEVEAFNKITGHFNKVKTMTGNFIQIDPKGNQVEGRFFIERPGKMRFEYEKSYPLQIISDGDQVYVHNKKLKNWRNYPLSKTPVKLLLGDRITLDNKSVRKVEDDAGLTIVTLGNKSVFGNQTIKMMFDSQTYDLRQWNTVDKQGGETQVLIFDVREGVRFAKNVFRVNKEAIAKTRDF